MIDPEKWPEVLSIDVGDSALALEIARRWNHFPAVLAACKELLETCEGLRKDPLHTYGVLDVIVMAESVIENAERSPS